MKSSFNYTHALVLGLGKSGISTVRQLHKMGINITVNEGKKEAECAYANELREKNIPVIYGQHPLSLLDSDVDLIVKSPGIPYNNPVLALALEKKIPTVTEIEIGYQLTDKNIIGITGSNGKTTTTSLVGNIFKTADVSSDVCGNIGTVFLDMATNETSDWLVTELSSFQLKGTENFRPNIACLLNFSETHLDFHGTVDDYFTSKRKIFQNQTKEDYAVLNYDVPLFHTIVDTIPSNLYWFSLKQVVPKGTYVKNNSIYFKDELVDVKLADLSDIPLKGGHNIENVLAGALISYLAGISKEDIQKGIKHFQAVEHRLEYVSTIDEVDYYNDSKSTNPVSTVKACESFEQPIVLILGGKDRGSDFKELNDVLMHQNIKSVVTFGETSLTLKQLAEKCGVDSYTVETLDECVEKAHAVAEKGDIVLLSPACASWDMYASYEKRGKHFKELIEHTKKNA